LVTSASAELRLQAAGAFLCAWDRARPGLIVAPTPGASAALLAQVLPPESACFGWRRRTLDVLAGELALPVLARAGQSPVRRLGLEALCARAVHGLAASERLGRFAVLRRRPGFVHALASSLEELRLAGVSVATLDQHDADLARILAAYIEGLEQAKLADRARVFEAATERVRAGASEWLGQALLLLDVPLLHAAEASLAVALADRAPSACVTLPLGDALARAAYLAGLGERAIESRLDPEGQSALGRLQRGLFAEPAADGGAAGADPSVGFASSPGESRECVEVARAILAAAESGVVFDRIAIGVRAVENYRAVLEEALRRARIPAYFADGVRRPAAEGRAFNALLDCAADSLSSRSFAEYLSLGVMPRTAAEPELASPQRWERLLVDAAVVGGRTRWTRRLQGLAQSLKDHAASLDADDPRRERLDRERSQLAALAQFAFPLLDALEALPRSAAWRDWLPALEALALLALDEPDAVCNTLAELAPLGPVGPVTLQDVRRLLSPRLRSLIVPSTGPEAGQVYVASLDELRGRSFARVFVVGLAEKVFPARIGEDPLLPDRVRRLLAPAPLTTTERIARERLLLRLGVGAASERVVLSYPRFDLQHGRPRVPSFYGLEALQAICGELPAFDELARRADPGAAPRLGWPAPSDPERAIDDAEYDVAILERFRSRSEPSVGAARYLLQSNPYLARALRFRARRWQLPRFHAADGFVLSSAAAEQLLPLHSLAQRAYSASALAQFASCPYKFYLSALARLAEPERIAEVDELDARQRGVLFHAVQRDVLTELQAAGLLPLTEAGVARARELLVACLERALEQAREAYAPAIDRVFDAALSSLRADLSGWLSTLLADRDWQPLHAELEFGFERQRDAQDAGVREQVRLAPGLLLSGAIDLVEQHIAPTPEGQLLLRATDHKTGTAQGKLFVSQGGTVLQPLLYALALEQLFPGAAVRGGRLHFCTKRGRYEVQEVVLNDQARQVAQRVVAAIGGMLERGFLPAAPARGACELCKFRVICGPYEEDRVAQVKARDGARLLPLIELRGLP
jgi:ATP-dependent helicase/nuclease subunit B